MSEKKNLNKDNNNILKDRKEWSHEWGLEKQTEGLDKHAVAKQHRIAEEIKKQTIDHPKKINKYELRKRNFTSNKG